MVSAAAMAFVLVAIFRMSPVPVPPLRTLAVLFSSSAAATIVRAAALAEPSTVLAASSADKLTVSALVKAALTTPYQTQNYQPLLQ